MSTATPPHSPLLNKVPEVTLAFWVIKLLSTTVGETGADYLAVNAGLGTGVTAAVMVALLAGCLALQMREARYVLWKYWITVILVSVVGTQLTDALTDKLGVSLYASTAAFAAGLAVTFIAWYRTEATLSIRSVDTPRREAFYWLAILFTFALGTAAGDLATEALGLGFTVGVIAFGALISAIVVAWRLGLNAIAAFWAAYILTRPLGAALGDLLSQSKEYGGFGLGATATSIAFLLAIAALVAMLSTRAHLSPRKEHFR